MKIKDFPLEDRPREKILYQGIQYLSNTELLAVLLGNGNKKENAIELSRKLLQQTELHDLAKKSVNEICILRGIGIAKAAKVIAAFELGRRAATSKVNKEDMRYPDMIAKKYLPQMSKLNQEHLKCLFLDTRLRLIKEETIFIGSVNSSVVHPREIFNAAIKNNATAIIMLHNHPSGDPEPSDEDIQFTQQMSAASAIMGIELLDHIVLGATTYYSMKEQNVMNVL